MVGTHKVHCCWHCPWISLCCGNASIECSPSTALTKLLVWICWSHVPAPTVGPPGISSDFCPTSMCWQPACACIFPELIAVPTVSTLRWDCYGGSTTSLWAHVDNGPPMADPASILCTFPVVASTTLRGLQAVSVQLNQVLSLGLSAQVWVEFQNPGTAHSSRHASQAGKCSEVARTVCAALSSEAPYLSLLTSQPEKEVPRVREHFLFHNSLPDMQVPSQFLFSPLFILPSYVVIFLAALVVWDLLTAFSKYSVRIVPHVDVFLMYL